jgi:MOSC domain-containing protein YiiM
VQVKSIHIAKGRRLPTRTVDTVVAEEGKGLVGDRYHGTRHRHVTIQSQELLDRAARDLGHDFDPGTTRRNITVDAGEIPTKPGTRVQIGDVDLEVVRVSAPCRLLDDEIGPGAAAALRRRSGSVCRILTGGTITVGDSVTFRDAAEAQTCTGSAARPRRVTLGL